MKKLRFGALLLCALIALVPAIVGATLISADKQRSNGEDMVTFHFLNVNSIHGDDGRDIGSADCTIIVDHGVVTVVDTGTKNKTSTDYISEYLENLGITRIDHLFITHPHDDHIGGVPAIVKKFDVTNYYYTAPKDWSKVRPLEIDWNTKDQFDKGMEAVREKINSDGSAINIISPDEEGKVYRINDNSYFTVYNCLAVVKNNYREPEFNDFSMMMKYTYKNFNALITGDINIQYEYVLTGEVNKDGMRCAAGSEEAIAPLGEINLLKVAHHGTEGSLHTENFLNSINPDKKAFEAVITGHRANIGASVLGRLNKYGYSVKITHDGTVTVSTDGTRASVSQETAE